VIGRLLVHWSSSFLHIELELTPPTSNYRVLFVTQHSSLAFCCHSLTSCPRVCKHHCRWRLRHSSLLGEAKTASSSASLPARTSNRLLCLSLSLNADKTQHLSSLLTVVKPPIWWIHCKWRLVASSISTAVTTLRLDKVDCSILLRRGARIATPRTIWIVVRSQENWFGVVLLRSSEFTRAFRRKPNEQRSTINTGTCRNSLSSKNLHFRRKLFSDGSEVHFRRKKGIRVVRRKWNHFRRSVSLR